MPQDSHEHAREFLPLPPTVFQILVALAVELDERSDPDEDDERRRYYRLTTFGREVANTEADRLTTLLRQARAAGLRLKRGTS